MRTLKISMLAMFLVVSCGGDHPSTPTLDMEGEGEEGEGEEGEAEAESESEAESEAEAESESEAESECEPEICNGFDDDCDGEADEGVLNACGGCGILHNIPGEPCDNELLGECFRAGTFECAGEEIGCSVDSPTPAADDAGCDGADSDCDGITDEDYVDTETNCGIGACQAAGTLACIDGVELDDCIPNISALEICDGITDENCDGETDEGCVCVNGAEQSCGPEEAGTGECLAGILRCENGVWNLCAGARWPDLEFCDGLDNDCDGEADEGLGLTTCGRGVCEHTVANCVDGEPTECDQFAGSSDETCNGLDDNCDGEVDEVFADWNQDCDNGLAGECYADGRYVCAADGSRTECNAPTIAPVAEVCDGEDNDCDGETDDALAQACSTACGSGTEVCMDGVWVDCDAPPVIPEVCDGEDNNCDSEVDEGVLNACGGCGTLEGAPGSPCDDGRHLGACGVWRCSPDLSAVVCADDDSADEICDGLDNNCDGEVDNGIPGGPMIVFTYVTPVCSSGSQPVAGIVCNVENPADFRVAIYIMVDSGWWTKPYFTAPLRTIGANRLWQSPINTGGCDRSAVRVRAYLVPVGYDPPRAAGSPELAPELEDNALDFDEVDRTRRHVEFAGYEWEVKESCGCALEPGPCRFTDDAEHLWVDADGELHLTIKYRDPYFYCTEVVLPEHLGYGQYRWDLASDVSDLDPNVVFAGFVYRYFTNAEFDIEFSSGLASPFNTQYVVQPWDQSGHRQRWNMPLCNASTHALRWCRGYVHFESDCLDADSAWEGYGWIFEEGGSFRVPEPTIEHPRINAWLIRNQPPTDGQDVEIIVSDFNFTPLESLPLVPIAEVSDGRDNDCDGEVDE